MSILKVEGLSKTFKDVKALDNVSFQFEKGILSFLGPSGCGKTTLLRSIAGLEIPDAGSISIADEIQSIRASCFHPMPGKSASCSRTMRSGRI